jgi:hypothetical protein
VDWVRKISVEGTKNKQIQEIATLCKSQPDPLKCVFNKVYDLVLYQPCPDNNQSLRTVENMLREGNGNCVNYSTMLASILLLMNVPFFFRTVAYSNPRSYDHIYIVTKSGIVLDPVQGQKQDGTDTRENRPKEGNFNSEVTYKFKQDFAMPNLSILQGTSPETHRDKKTGYPNSISRSRTLRRAKAGLLGCDNCASCKGCSEQKTLGRTWVGTAWSFVKDVVVESVISPINVTALQLTGENLIKYDPITGIGDKYVTAQNFAGRLINDSIKVGIESPITAFNTVTGAGVDPGFHYNTKISSTFAKTEKKAQYLFVNIVGSLFGLKAYDSSKPKVKATAIPQNLLPAGIKPTTTAAGLGTYAMIGMGLLAVGSMKTKPNKKIS